MRIEWTDAHKINVEVPGSLFFVPSLLAAVTISAVMLAHYCCYVVCMGLGMGYEGKLHLCGATTLGVAK